MFARARLKVVKSGPELWEIMVPVLMTPDRFYLADERLSFTWDSEAAVWVTGYELYFPSGAWVAEDFFPDGKACKVQRGTFTMKFPVGGVTYHFPDGRSVNPQLWDPVQGLMPWYGEIDEGPDSRQGPGPSNLGVTPPRSPHRPAAAEPHQLRSSGHVPGHP